MSIKYKLVLVNIIIVPIFLSLANWQWQKAKLVKERQNQVQQLQKQPPLLSLDNINSNFIPVKITGKFLHSKTLLLNNQVLNSEPGFHLLTPLELDDSIVMVNRGWAPSQAVNDYIGTNDSEVTVGGITYYLRLPTVNYSVGNFPIVIEDVNFASVQSKFNKPILKFIIYLDKTSPYSSRMQYPFLVKNYKKNISYAVQWLIFAVLLLGLSGYIYFKNEE